MKKLIILLVSVFLYSCGGGGGGGVVIPQTAPVIADLYFYPLSATVGDGSGAVTITGYYSFSDPEANITTFTLNWSNSLGDSGTLSNNAILSGYSRGVASLAIVGDTSIASTTSFEFFVTDSTGLQSNKLTGKWTVYP